MVNNEFIRNTKILYIDDERTLLEAFKALLRKQPFELHLLDDPMQVESYLKQHGPFAVVLSDQKMHGRTGSEVLEIVKQIHPDTIRLLVTGYSDLNDALEAINRGGISQYIQKPWNNAELIRQINYYIEKYNLVLENKYLFIELNNKNQLLNELFEGTLSGIVNLFSNFISQVNNEAYQQSEKLSKLLDHYLPFFNNISNEEKIIIQFAAKLINLGITLLPSDIQAQIQKNGLVAISKIPAANNHHLLAAKMLENIPKLDQVAKIIKYFQKNYDGSGEPSFDFVNGKFIPFGSRLLRILYDVIKLSSASQNTEMLLKSMSTVSTKYDTDIIRTILDNISAASSVELSQKYDFSQPSKTISPLEQLLEEQQSLIDEAEAQKKSEILKDKDSFIFKCHLDQLVEGLIVLDDIITDSGIKLISAYTEITKHELDFLRVWKRTHNDQITSSVRVKVAKK
ncbi:MAG TPA: response regulator [Ignavibacteriales bacterium]|nr:response regulator [Ignavibacteriales bacterium]HOL82220.1 response regulator [Ignavibacteriales bacterium]HOM65658.1 response regulator [Ignavibacteriales bacterium]HPD67354.1 response regulator [Ignavibacteriales bacterium]HPP32879.1 response regulator [Ignavibacteriales bacterium]